MKPAAARRRPPHPVRPDSAPLLAVGAPAFAMAAWGGNHFSRLLLMYRQIGGYIAVQVNLFLALHPRAHPGSGPRGGRCGRAVAVAACCRAGRVPGGPQAARTVSSVISLGAKIRNGGPQKPVPRLV
jgi:hypothetical protein